MSESVNSKLLKQWHLDQYWNPEKCSKFSQGNLLLKKYKHANSCRKCWIKFLKLWPPLVNPEAQRGFNIQNWNINGNCFKNLLLKIFGDMFSCQYSHWSFSLLVCLKIGKHILIIGMESIFTRRKFQSRLRTPVSKEAHWSYKFKKKNEHQFKTIFFERDRHIYTISNGFSISIN